MQNRLNKKYLLLATMLWFTSCSTSEPTHKISSNTQNTNTVTETQSSGNTHYEDEHKVEVNKETN